MDRISREARSTNMSRIGSKNTKPEMLLRRLLFSMGYRYRVHHRIGAASVDLAFPKKLKAINVNGCFWHQHPGCVEASRPKTNSAYWRTKLQNNAHRDERNRQVIESRGWELLVVWECELERAKDTIASRVMEFIDNGPR